MNRIRICHSYTLDPEIDRVDRSSRSFDVESSWVVTTGPSRVDRL